MSIETEDEFRKELVEMFVQEAQQWLQEIHVALDELQQGPPPDRHIILTNTIKAGLTNICESAATIGLTEVERVSYSSLPFVETVQDPAAKISADDFLMLCKQLGNIQVTLTRATGVAFEDAAGDFTTESHSATVQTTDLLSALRALRERQGKPGPLHRNLIQTLINQLEGIDRQGVKQCDASSLLNFLDRLASEEHGFLQAVQQRLSSLTDQLARLKSNASEPESSPERLRAVVEQTGHLWLAAQQVNATQAMTFFKGLHSFLTIVMQRRVIIPSQKYEAVEFRLLESVNSFQKWVEAGRLERAEISSTLPNCATSKG